MAKATGQLIFMTKHFLMDSSKYKESSYLCDHCYLYHSTSHFSTTNYYFRHCSHLSFQDKIDGLMYLALIYCTEYRSTVLNTWYLCTALYDFVL